MGTSNVFWGILCPNQCVRTCYFDGCVALIQAQQLVLHMSWVRISDTQCENEIHDKSSAEDTFACIVRIVGQIAILIV
ncbi:MAG: hypothetical protein CL916_11175 [Deltaproteobacteria bacterium]|nr:hypothetical protein [Deltaproteobacteria bacterium]